MSSQFCLSPHPDLVETFWVLLGLNPARAGSGRVVGVFHSIEQYFVGGFQSSQVQLEHQKSPNPPEILEPSLIQKK